MSFFYVPVPIPVLVSSSQSNLCLCCKRNPKNPRSDYCSDECGHMYRYAHEHENSRSRSAPIVTAAYPPVAFVQHQHGFFAQQSNSCARCGCRMQSSIYAPYCSFGCRQ